MSRPKKYPDELVARGVGVARDSGRPIAAVARDLGVTRPDRGARLLRVIALLAQCLIERELRAAMTQHDVAELPLYHEDRASKAPTCARVFDRFADTARHHLTSHQDDKTVQIFEPQLTELQRQILDLLSIPQGVYRSTTIEP